MRQILNDFMMSPHRPDGAVRGPLGPESRSSQLVSLSDGEPILIHYPGNLAAEAIAASADRVGERWWYGIVASADAIRNLDALDADEPAERVERLMPNAKPRVR